MPMSDEVLMQYCKVIIFVVAGVCCLILSAALASDTRDFIASSVVVNGRVVALDHGGHHPRIEFVTKDGERTSFYGHSFWGLELGEQIPVRYKPSAPWHTATLGTFDSIWRLPLGFAAFGLLFTVGSVLEFLSKRASNLGR